MTVATETTHEVEELNGHVTRLARLRDEARLKVKLAEAEARDEWERLEKKWSHLRAVAELAAEESKTGVGEATAEVRKGFDHLVEELQTGYERIRRAL
ncbi:MAG TPA: hypothetical protein VF100_00625 [Thermoanaerobaculia bacterium]